MHIGRGCSCEEAVRAAHESAQQTSLRSKRGSRASSLRSKQVSIAGKHTSTHTEQQQPGMSWSSSYINPCNSSSLCSLPELQSLPLSVVPTAISLAGASRVTDWRASRISRRRGLHIVSQSVRSLSRKHIGRISNLGLYGALAPVLDVLPRVCSLSRKRKFRRVQRVQRSAEGRRVRCRYQEGIWS